MDSESLILIGLAILRVVRGLADACNGTRNNRGNSDLDELLVHGFFPFDSGVSIISLVGLAMKTHRRMSDGSEDLFVTVLSDLIQGILGQLVIISLVDSRPGQKSVP